jgi:hypothetical protein
MSDDRFSYVDSIFGFSVMTGICSGNLILDEVNQCASKSQALQSQTSFRCQSSF